jgi:hypothetical protein
MVERTVLTYVVVRVGDDDTAIGVAKGGIVVAKALLPKCGNTSAVPRFATAWCCPAPAVSWRRVSKTNTVAAISAAVKSCAQPAAFLLLVNTLLANAGGHLPASTMAAFQDAFFWASYSTNNATHSAPSWR